tara:strand:- start:11163 stop:12152 length:990 start_codon:yes stop_codon:yes gene_type:complete
MKKILVLGCSSFSGASMVDFLLKKKYFVLGTYSKKKPKILLSFSNNKRQKYLKTIKINLLKKIDLNRLLTFIKKEKPHIIIDFASICMVNESWKKPKKYFEINSTSKIYILNQIIKFNFLKKYIYISTPEVFGSQNNSIKESNNSFNPSTPYAVSKLICEDYIKNLIRNFKFNGIIARFSNFYGPGQPYYRLIPKIIISIIKKKKFPLHGDGKSKRNFIFSDDFCYGIYKIIIKGATGKIYHFSGNKLYSVVEIIKKVSNLMGKNFKKVIKKVPDRKGKDLIYNINSRLTEKELNWFCKTNIDVGISKLINYTFDNLNNIKNLPMEYKR